MNKNPIIPSGAFFPKTKSGYILNPCSFGLIDPCYHPLLKEITEAYIREEGPRLHSIYIRGSVPRGMCLGDCDLDTFALIYTETDRWRAADWTKKYNNLWSGKYPFVRNVELLLSSYAPVLRAVPEMGMNQNAPANPRLAMVLKTQSLCIYGETPEPLLPNYLPDERMMLAKHWLEEDIAAFSKNKKRLESRQQLLKTILRSGFELVMPEIQQYTTDLYLCYRSFATYHPRKEKWMRQALLAYLNPKKTSVSEVEDVVKILGNWLLKKTKSV